MTPSLEFKYFEIFFGLCTAGALIAQLHKTLKTKKTKDFSMVFIIGIIIKNMLSFTVGFINNLTGLMLGSFLLILYNIPIVITYYFGKQD